MHCIDKVLQKKGLAENNKNIIRCEKELKDAYSTVYNALCIDIDKTITESDNIITKHIISCFAKQIEKNNIVCFISGRGKNSGNEFIKNLARRSYEISNNRSIRTLKRWYSIVNDGAVLYYSKDIGWDSFLSEKIILIDDKTINSFNKDKDKIRDLIVPKLAKLLDIPENALIEWSKHSGTNFSVRFPVHRIVSFNEKAKVVNVIKSVLKKSRFDISLFVSHGIYINQSVFDVTITTKGEAVAKVEKLLGIPRNKMVRIGDQGSIYGNDYDMLSCKQGFSVMDISKDIDKCFPAVNNCKILSGIKATEFFLTNLKIYPSYLLEKTDKDHYVSKLSKSEKEAEEFSINTIKNYANLVSSWLNFQNEKAQLDIYDIIDESGAIKFKDWEYHYYKETKLNSVLYEIFSRKEKHDCKQPTFRYSFLTDDSFLLRAPKVYYHGLCFRDNEKFSKQDIVRWLNDSFDFISLALTSLENSNSNHEFQIENSFDRRTLIGYMDNVRNILLILLNSLLESACKEKKCLIYFEKYDNINLNELYDIIKIHTTYMYDALFGGIYPFVVEEYFNFIHDKVLNTFRNEYLLCFKKWSDEYNFNKGFRVWREIDNFFENVVAVNIALNQFEEHLKDFKESNKRILGIRYGSIELPIIADILMSKKNDEKCTIGAVSLNLSYPEKRLKGNNIKVDLDVLNEDCFCFNQENNCTDEESGNTITILTDDNLATGTTLQIASSLLVKCGIMPKGAIIVRYPSLNRVEHMFVKDSIGMPDVDLFFNMIRGLVSPSPYSRLNSTYVYSDVEKEMYLDELGVFNMSRDRVSKYLLKNGLYSRNSEITEFEKIKELPIVNKQTK